MTTPVIVLAVLSIAVAPHGPLVAALMALSITAVSAVGALMTISGSDSPPDPVDLPDEDGEGKLSVERAVWWSAGLR